MPERHRPGEPTERRSARHRDRGSVDRLERLSRATDPERRGRSHEHRPGARLGGELRSRGSVGRSADREFYDQLHGRQRVRRSGPGRYDRQPRRESRLHRRQHDQRQWSVVHTLEWGAADQWAGTADGGRAGGRSAPQRIGSERSHPRRGRRVPTDRDRSEHGDERQRYRVDPERSPPGARRTVHRDHRHRARGPQRPVQHGVPAQRRQPRDHQPRVSRLRKLPRARWQRGQGISESRIDDPGRWLVDGNEGGLHGR